MSIRPAKDSYSFRMTDLIANHPCGWANTCDRALLCCFFVRAGCRNPNKRVTPLCCREILTLLFWLNTAHAVCSHVYSSFVVADYLHPMHVLKPSCLRYKCRRWNCVLGPDAVEDKDTN